jgi:hypothetical protein
MVWPAMIDARGTDSLKVAISLPRLKASVFWNITISSAGVAFCDRTFVNGVSPGLMLMRVNRLNGEFSGTYIPSEGNSRYRVYGVTLDPVSSPSIRAAGWVEYGTAPAITSGSWTLQNKR